MLLPNRVGGKRTSVYLKISAKSTETKPDAGRDVLETRICVEVWLIAPVEGIEMDSEDVEQMFKEKYGIDVAVVKFEVR